MRSALEQEIRARLDALAARLGRHDRLVLLGVALCFVPFPPATLAGFLLTCMNLMLIRKGTLPRWELPLLGVGLAAILGYVALWTGLIVWSVRSGEPGRLWDLLTSWARWVVQLSHGVLMSPPATIQHV